MGVVGLDHVQLAMPAGGEDAARAFYTGLLGLVEIPKPAELAKRGGCWFAVPGTHLQVHLGVEHDFRPARKAHPGLLVDDLAALAAQADGFAYDTALAGVTRGFAADPFGNRVELVQR